MGSSRSWSADCASAMLCPSPRPSITAVSQLSTSSAARRSRRPCASSLRIRSSGSAPSARRRRSRRCSRSIGGQSLVGHRQVARRPRRRVHRDGRRRRRRHLPLLRPAQRRAQPRALRDRDRATGKQAEGVIVYNEVPGRGLDGARRRGSPARRRRLSRPSACTIRSACSARRAPPERSAVIREAAGVPVAVSISAQTGHGGARVPRRRSARARTAPTARCHRSPAARRCRR